MTYGGTTAIKRCDLILPRLLARCSHVSISEDGTKGGGGEPFTWGCHLLSTREPGWDALVVAIDH